MAAIDCAANPEWVQEVCSCLGKGANTTQVCTCLRLRSSPRVSAVGLHLPEGVSNCHKVCTCVKDCGCFCVGAGGVQCHRVSSCP
ncbi:hypothetical protein DUNSADRAFT_13766 [Dunaliella salina]|uniref:Uncharacterized protein n=1 Tax=Dunaliella salina TaxID=3046 RepID=A0ABQ7G8T2_DUNSA|nr:hypothetical protein DUNSADRAFT_13766 [Dunaliella salina]|eukprot:KAF5831009.1 hypothetical protein DUNSADRAFT_13766 [Dunaliella salina]